MARRKQADEATARVRNLIALDAANIMRRLDTRRGEMLALFSRLRSREPMLSTRATRYTTATFQALVHLTTCEQSVVDQFYECLDALRWYFTYTEDMPSTAQQTFNTLHRRLEAAYRQFVATLGHPVSPDGSTVVEGEVLRRSDTPPEASLVSAAPARKRRAPLG
ncbi:hypothetical protein ACN28E_12770 [Archangium lansingense]|uniref:hypothetical protein n=1 Tax=Archangium lansingense TaxID=2995310 RepID=UPI003B7CD555